jgi:hypothetical protein
MRQLRHIKELLYNEATLVKNFNQETVKERKYHTRSSEPLMLLLMKRSRIVPKVGLLVSDCSVRTDPSTRY